MKHGTPRAGRLSRQEVARLPVGSVPEILLAEQLRQDHIGFTREWPITPERKFRADFIVGRDLIIEVEGGVWTRGYHVRGGGFELGCEKQALAVIAGYRYLRVTSNQVNDGRALEWIKQALGVEAAA